jgi:hypothetical protein
MKNWYKYVAITVLIFLMLTISSEILYAQCPMCKIAVESNMKNGGTAGQGLNKGIFIILSMPYLIVGTLVVVWLRNRKKSNELL